MCWLSGCGGTFGWFSFRSFHAAAGSGAAGSMFSATEPTTQGVEKEVPFHLAHEFGVKSCERGPPSSRIMSTFRNVDRTFAPLAEHCTQSFALEPWFEKDARSPCSSRAPTPTMFGWLSAAGYRGISESWFPAGAKTIGGVSELAAR